MQFLARLKRDYTNFSDRKIKLFDFKDIKIFKVGPMNHNCYGMRFEFGIGEPANVFMNYNSQNWLDS